MDIGTLVKDWGGFEKLLAQLNETGEVAVEHNVKLSGRSGAARQIDVLIRHRQGLYEHLVVAECKYWNVAVDRAQVDALATTVREVGASRGVIFSTHGFQTGAITQARHDNIDLFTVRDLFDSEWGRPGRVLNFVLQIIQPSMANFDLKHATRLSRPFSQRPAFFKFQFGPSGAISSTPTLSRRGNPPKSVEDYLMDAVGQGVEQMLSRFSTLNGGEECTRYLTSPQNVTFSEPLLLPLDGEVIAIPQLSYELGIKITQSQVTIDRGAKYAFALAVENCVNGGVVAASRYKTEVRTTIEDLGTQPDYDPAIETPLENGSVVRCVLKGFFPLEELNGKDRVPIEQCRKG